MTGVQTCALPICEGDLETLDGALEDLVRWMRLEVGGMERGGVHGKEARVAGEEGDDKEPGDARHARRGPAPDVREEMGVSGGGFASRLHDGMAIRACR